MTSRELQIAQSLLNALHQLDGGQMSEAQLHGATGVLMQTQGQINPTLMEFNSVLVACDSQGWITGVPSRFNPRVKKWNINDAGEAARLEM